MEVNTNFWFNKSVFLTGHTGFKGGWLALWLSEMGANVFGYSLKAPTVPNFFTETKLEERLKKSIIGDVCNATTLNSEMESAKPSIIIHMAAQPLVRESYNSPTKTFMTNVMGTINLLEAARKIETVKVIVNVTTDKCYVNKEKSYSYFENDRLGGYDPYSSSKACSEIASAAYRDSFLSDKNISLATVRAGNVIGGGDWALDRLIPDFFKALESKETLYVRYPNAIRPWQHVLDPLSGYLILAQKLYEKGGEYAEAWNFGPENNDEKSVSWIIKKLSKKFPSVRWELNSQRHPHEATLLKLDISKAKSKLGWFPRWSLETALENTSDWYEAYKNKESMADFSIKQINDYKRL